ncbi:replication protein [Bacillus sp. ISL-75]|uniref:replication protein n=1 Tax=Bacillus sp. ISL-75 TaxID=2819137 RepID=UPI001BEC37B7|nr:replication protein [Bacillus sp. ISL-75]MBT2727866.1 replication protein [Bacillus sp. ISL-75]
MADVQPEHGYTRIAHEILEYMAKIKLSPTQYRILFLVWRYTYGFNRKEHDLSLSFLSEGTGCDKRQIQRELTGLENKKIIFQNIKNGAYRKISFNKNYEQWATIGETTIGETVNTAIGETVNTTIDDFTNQERNNLKINIKIKDDDMQTNYFTEYEKAFGYPPALLISDFTYWIDSEKSQFTEPEEIIIEIIHRAKKAIPRNPAKYISKILKDLHDMELYSLEAVEAYNKKFDEKMSNGGANNGKKYRRGNGRSASESPKESIFGNKVGRY